MKRLLMYSLLAVLATACLYNPPRPVADEDFGSEDPGYLVMHLDSIVWSPTWSVSNGERRPPIEVSYLGNGILILARRAIANGIQEVSVFVEEPILVGEEILPPFDEASITFRNTANDCRYLSAQDGFIRITGFDRVAQSIRGEFQIEYSTEACGYTSLTNGNFSLRY
ncbi:MAG TPA: hypothetical protein DCE41_22790 [Cytophagales bacterium]|nr:hypothetical protein [Cytophagales bacterium]HAA22890.1 hypothetical protein [Cytophagales bacterium]HAP60558.1 hypothetical protein [Cytophagales bacterium]